ncbi:MAG: PEP-CTERM sorting domain-containing protein [Gemmatimonadaceae bacterium]
MQKTNLLKSLFVVTAMSVLPNVALSQITVYTTLASYLAAITNPGTDTYAGFSTTSATASPIVRSAGSYTYTAMTSADGFLGAGSPANLWLSTNTVTDAITFSGFTAGVKGVGGNFFGSNLQGTFQSGDIKVAATDASGTTTLVILGATTSSFLGFVTAGTAFTNVQVSANQPVGATLWPTVDNLVLGQSPSSTMTPEPATLVLLGAGFACLAVVSRRRRMR